MTLKNLDIPRLQQLAENLWTGGQPSAEQLRQAREAGLQTAVNLCPAGECGWDEKTVAETLGLRYATLPIGAASDLSEDTARRLHELLESCPTGSLGAPDSFLTVRRKPPKLQPATKVMNA